MESKLSRSRVYTGVSYTEWKHDLPFHILPVKQQATSSTVKNLIKELSNASEHPLYNWNQSLLSITEKQSYLSITDPLNFLLRGKHIH